MAALPLGDSSTLQVGQKVLAIGDPFGFQSTLTTGVVSALGRTVQTSETTFIDEAIQTDASINRGNSGGPLINTHGEVIGINSAIYTPSGTTAGIGFAIPINTAKLIANDLMTEGQVRRAYLGVSARFPWPDGWRRRSIFRCRKDCSSNRPPRAVRRRPREFAAATIAQAGMRRIMIGGDVIVGLEGQKVANQFDIEYILNRKRPGDTVTITVYRGGQESGYSRETRRTRRQLIRPVVAQGPISARYRFRSSSLRRTILRQYPARAPAPSASLRASP